MSNHQKSYEDDDEYELRPNLSNIVQNYNARLVRVNENVILRKRDKTNERREQEKLQNNIVQGIEQNQHDLLESIVNLNQIVKKNGRMQLEPKN